MFWKVFDQLYDDECELKYSKTFGRLSGTKNDLSNECELFTEFGDFGIIFAWTHARSMEAILFFETRE